MSGKPRTLEFWDARREGLLRAARAELADAGVEGLTLERVARRAGVSKGAVQYAFGSKDQLLGELAHDTLFSIYSDGIAATREGEPIDLADLVDALSRGLASDEGRLVALVALMATARRSAATREALANFYVQTDSRIAAALRDAGIAAASDEDLATIVRGTRGAVLGMFVHWVVHPQDRTLDDVAHEVRGMLTRLLLGGEPVRAACPAAQMEGAGTGSGSTGGTGSGVGSGTGSGVGSGIDGGEGSGMLGGAGNGSGIGGASGISGGAGWSGGSAGGSG